MASTRFVGALADQAAGIAEAVKAWPNPKSHHLAGEGSVGGGIEWERMLHSNTRTLSVLHRTSVSSAMQHVTDGWDWVCPGDDADGWDWG